jgi:hypothetical protein
MGAYICISVWNENLYFAYPKAPSPETPLKSGATGQGQPLTMASFEQLRLSTMLKDTSADISACRLRDLN